MAGHWGERETEKPPYKCPVGRNKLGCSFVSSNGPVPDHIYLRRMLSRILLLLARTISL